MRRLALNILTAVSLLLLIATIAIWLRSYTGGDSFGRAALK